ncbi:MAG: Ig-like domain-containing protein [Eubacteriales bacterium]|nr:Ig-like domain-containing protein [Eubacteriales bacterium]
MKKSRYKLGRLRFLAVVLAVVLTVAGSITASAASEVVIAPGGTKTFSWSDVGYSKHRIDSSVWTISDTSVARIVGNTYKTCDVRGVARGTCTLTCNIRTSYTYYDFGVGRYITHTANNTLSYNIRVAPPAPPVSSVILNKKNATLKRTGTLQLKCTVKPAGSNKKVKWTSSNPAVASVSQSGLITAKKAGTTVITVTASNGKKAACTVKVTKVNATGIKLSRKKATVERGQTLKLTYTLTPKGGEAKVTWSSSNKKVASVTSKGLVTGISTGSAVITAKLPSGKKAVCNITVPGRVSAKSVTISKTSLYIKRWQTETLTAKITPANATDEVVWSSSDESVAQINKKGVLESQRPGTAVITASANGHTATCKVMVLGGEWLDLSKGPITITSRGVAVQNGQKHTFDDFTEGLYVVQSSSAPVQEGITVKKDVGTKIVLAGVNIDSGKSAFLIEDDSNADVTLELMKGTVNTLVSFWAGIQKNGEYGYLWIDGEGTLDVTGGPHCAAIGSSAYQPASCIYIKGGVIRAKTYRGNDDSAVIGAGGGASCEHIHIRGGRITASGGYQAVGRGRTLKAGTTTERNIEIAEGVLTYNR